MHNSDMMSSSWRKSSFSEAGNCVEVTVGEGPVLVRDNKFITGGGMLSFSPPTWRQFVEAVKKI